MGIERKLELLFDYQKFEKNPRLDGIIRKSDSVREELSDEALEFVSAAGVSEPLKKIFKDSFGQKLDLTDTEG